MRDGRYYDYETDMIIADSMLGAYVICDAGGLVDGMLWDDYCMGPDCYIDDGFVFDDGYDMGGFDVVDDGYGDYGGYGGDFGGDYGGGDFGGDCGGGDY